MLMHNALYVGNPPRANPRANCRKLSNNTLPVPGQCSASCNMERLDKYEPFLLRLPIIAYHG